MPSLSKMTELTWKVTTIIVNYDIDIVKELSKFKIDVGFSQSSLTIDGLKYLISILNSFGNMRKIHYVFKQSK